MLTWFTIAAVLLASVAANGQALPKAPPPLPAFEDQLYMIGRAQEEEIRQLRRENEELHKRVDELGKKGGDPPSAEGK